MTKEAEVTMDVQCLSRCLGLGKTLIPSVCF